MLPDNAGPIAFRIPGLTSSLPWVLVPVILYFLTRAARRTDTGKPSTPPGPQPLPILGNILSLSGKKPWETFAALSKEYGDVVYLQIFGQPIIMLSSVEAVNDIFESRSGIYSDRPFLPLMHLIGHDQWNFSFMPYNQRSRALCRKFLEKYSTPSATCSFHDAQRAAGIKFLSSALHDPDSVLPNIKLRASRLILDVTYGIEVDSNQDPFVKAAEGVMATASFALSPAMWLLTPTTILRYLLGWLGNSTVAKWHKDWHVPPTSRPSYKNGRRRLARTRRHLYAILRLSLTEIVSTSEIFLLSMVRYPHAQKRAQEEIDRVMGSDRLPDYADRSHMPYVSALMKEVLRWHPAGPTGVPHRLTQDSVETVTASLGYIR